MNPFFILYLAGAAYVLTLFVGILLSSFLPAFEVDPEHHVQSASAKVFFAISLMFALAMLLFMGIPMGGLVWTLFDVIAWTLNSILPPVANHTEPPVSSIVFAHALFELLPVQDSATRSIETVVFLMTIATLVLSSAALVISYVRVMSYISLSAIGLNIARRVDAELALQSLPIHVNRLRHATIAVFAAAFIFVANIAAIVMIAL
jgi:hypothetical protein